MDHEVRALWGGAGTAPTACLLHEPFEAQAACRPEAVAVRCGSSHLTYGELNARSNQLACRLRREGVGPDVMVGLYVERTLDAVVGLVGILKAGGAYVPLDPTNPASRTRFVIADANPRVIVTQLSLRAHVSIGDVRVLCLDEIEWTGSEGREPPEKTTGSDNLAYVIYTSGSTGQPKGTLVTHRNVDRLFRTTECWFDFGGNDVWTVFHSFSFDFSVWELWGALRYGGTAVIVPGSVARSPGAFHALLRMEEVTVLCQTPSAFYALIDADRTALAHELPALRFVIFGGEALEFRRLAPWFERHGAGMRLINMYGITETTVHATYFPVSRDAADGESRIGVPLPDLQIHLLDESLEPVEPGCVGEIFVGGPGVTRGYLNRPELTARRFIPDSVTGVPGRRLYRSGDLARVTQDGQLVYCGRIDDQVKLRGYRIELGEIESALERCPGVRRSAVLVRDGPESEKELVAYVMGADGADIVPRALRARLADTLPAYMVPAAFVAMRSWPLTNNGKLDKAALPAPRREDRIETAIDLPRTRTEREVAAVWAAMFATDRIGIFDDFFALGAHSLMFARACASLREAFHVPIAIADVLAAPNVASLAARIDGIAHADEPDDGPGPVRDGGDVGCPPTALAQDAALYICDLAPGTRAYNNQVTIRLHGDLNIGLLERVLTEIVRRHESLRTTFARGADGWTQVVHPPYAVYIDVADDAPGRIRALFERRFDPGRLPLVCWTLVRQSPRDHVLAHIEHHLIHDGWSFGVFVQELVALYRAYHEGRPSPLEELPIQFGDYARWQRRRYAEGRFDEGIAYWRAKLAGAPTVLDLPAEHARPAIQTFEGDEVQVELAMPLARSLRAYARSRQTSLFGVMLAGFAATLSRFAGQRDIVIGSGFANRERKELARLIGMVVNMLPLRLDLKDDPTFEDLVSHAQAVSRDAMAHQDVPFEAIVRALDLPPDASRNPLCQVAFSFHDSALPPVRLPGVSGELDYPHNGSAKFDMNVIVIPYAEQQAGEHVAVRDQRITIKWECNTDIFDLDAVRLMLNSYLRVLEQGIAQPHLRASCFLDADPADRRQFDTWNATERPYPRDVGIPAIFAEQVARTPANVALVCGNDKVSYRELESLADRIARYLRSAGVDRGVLVGICMQRSIDMVAAILGILKAGGAYVPLDPEYPAARLATMLDDARPAVIVTAEAQCSRLPDFRGRVVCIDIERETIMAATQIASLPDVRGDDLAYVIYTSGSTGRPRGVCVEHRSVGRLVKNTDFASLDASQRFLQLAPISFDASTFELWGSLLNGAQLVVCKPGVPTLGELGTMLRTHRITTLWLTAALFHQMVDFELDALAGVPQILAGGEALSVEHVRRMVAAMPDGHRLINGYGPTENTTFTCCHSMTRSAIVERSVPIGRPIANTKVHVLDDQRRVVPLGAPGELYIEGDGLARGYLRQAEWTAERFVEVEGRRLYRSGDRARWLADGTIEFLGRIDDQIKLRGFRIEPGDVETALNGHAAVRESAVVVRDSVEGRRLVAFVVGKGGPRTNATDLREHLSRTLPAYMIPAMFVPIDALPLTPVGKVDRAALVVAPLPETTAPRRQPPRTATEQAIAEIWKRHLARDDVGVDDDFFESGGHSLTAAAICAEIATRLDVRLPLAMLFEARTIAGLASAVDLRKSSMSSELLTPIRREGRRTPIFAMLGIGGNYAGSEALAAMLGDDRPFFSLEMPGLANQDVPKASIEDIVARLRAEIHALSIGERCILLGACAGAFVVYELARRLAADGFAVEHVIMLDPPPSGPERARRLSSFDRWRQLAVPRFIAARVWLTLRTFVALDKSQRAAFLRQKMAVAREIVARRDLLRESRIEVQVTRVREAASAALTKFVPSAYGGRVTLIMGERRPPAEARTAAARWAALCTGSFDTAYVPGKNSGLMLKSPNVEVVASRMRTLLAEH